MQRTPLTNLLTIPYFPLSSLCYRDLRLREERSLRHAATIEELRAAYDPSRDPKAEGDAFKTLFVGRLSYEVTERKLRREFEEFGPVRRIRLVHDKDSGKPKGYAFIEYEHIADMKQAYKMGDGRRIEGMRCLVDVERGRTVSKWRPRRLGGGKGGAEGREARQPKDPKRLFVTRLMEAAAARNKGHDEEGKEEEEERAAPKERVRERDRSRSPGGGRREPPPSRGRSREQDRSRRERSRSRSQEEGELGEIRAGRGGPDDGYGGGYMYGRERERDFGGGDTRKRDRGYGGGRDDDRYAKRARERDLM
jgi:U1 small nuclear ribonucleoprotein 70kDa